jgi:hypothetical protein
MKKALFFLVLIFIVGANYTNAQKNSQLFKGSQLIERFSTPSADFEPIVNFMYNGKGPNSDVYYGYGTPNTIMYKATVSSFPGTSLGSSGRKLQASEYIDGVLYAGTYDASTGGNTFGTISMTNGAFSVIKTAFGNDAMSMCFNPTNGLTYVFAWGGSFGTVDLATGNYSNIGSVGEYNFYAAIDNNGICYAIPLSTQSNAPFGTINLATGAYTQTGLIPFNTNWIQEMSVDRETNELYWLASEFLTTTTWNNYYYKVNKQNGALTSLANVNFSDRPSVFSIVSELVFEPCDPISNLVCNPVGNTVYLSWDAAPGDPIGYRITFNGNVLTTVTENFYTHVGVPDKLQTYSVAAIYLDDCTPFDVTQTVIVGDWCMMRFEMDVYPGTHPDEPGVIFDWNGTSIEVWAGNVFCGEATVSHASLTATEYILVPSGAIEFLWAWEPPYGYFHDQSSFKIFNSNNELIFTCHRGDANWDPYEPFFFYTNDCRYVQPTCFPVAITATLEGTDKARIAWNYTGSNTINVYRDEEKIASNITAAYYIDEDPMVGENCYTIEMNCEDGDVSPMSNKACVIIPNSIKDISKAGFTIAPNPASNQINITAQSDFNTVEIVNFLGQTVLTQMNNSNKAIIDVSNLTNGVYFVRILSNNGISVQKFVKQ